MRKERTQSGYDGQYYRVIEGSADSLQRICDAYVKEEDTHSRPADAASFSRPGDFQRMYDNRTIPVTMTFD